MKATLSAPTFPALAGPWRERLPGCQVLQPDLNIDVSDEWWNRLAEAGPVA
jgi:hypothetical protein